MAGLAAGVDHAPTACLSTQLGEPPPTSGRALSEGVGRRVEVGIDGIYESAAAMAQRGETAGALCSGVMQGLAASRGVWAFCFESCSIPLCSRPALVLNPGDCGRDVVLVPTQKQMFRRLPCWVALDCDARKTVLATGAAGRTAQPQAERIGSSVASLWVPSSALGARRRGMRFVSRQSAERGWGAPAAAHPRLRQRNIYY